MIPRRPKVLVNCYLCLVSQPPRRRECPVSPLGAPHPEKLSCLRKLRPFWARQLLGPCGSGRSGSGSHPAGTREGGQALSGGTLWSSLSLSILVHAVGPPSPSGLEKTLEGAAFPVSGLETEVGPRCWLRPVREGEGGGVPTCPRTVSWF